MARRRQKKRKRGEGERPIGEKKAKTKETSDEAKAKKGKAQDRKEKKTKVKLPSAAALLSKVPGKVFGEGPESVEEETEADSSKARYNRVAPPNSLLAGEGLEDEWKVKPIAPLAKYKAVFSNGKYGGEPVDSIPTAAVARPRFAPPQVARGRPNVSVEDLAGWNVEKPKSRA